MYFLKILPVDNFFEKSENFRSCFENRLFLSLFFWSLPGATVRKIMLGKFYYYVRIPIASFGTVNCKFYYYVEKHIYRRGGVVPPVK